jgi:hypothetical protein
MKIRLAYASINSKGRRGLSGIDSKPGKLSSLPSVLVSYVYLKPFLASRPTMRIRDWVMDSGAFTAHHMGKVIDLDDYTGLCRDLKAQDKMLSEVFALDDLADWRISLRNTLQMWKAGVEAIPCFHYGEPWEVLDGLAADFPKIALGGCVWLSATAKEAFTMECFHRVWPKPIHGFGFGSERHIMQFPFDSVDATNWQIGPMRFGTFRSIGKASVRRLRQRLNPEVEIYLKMEREARMKFRACYEQLEKAERKFKPCVLSTDSQVAKLIQ